MSQPVYYRTVCLLVLLATGFITACSTSSSSRYAMHQDRGPEQDINVSHIPDAIPRAEPRSKSGNPASYVVNGRRYHVLQNSKGYRQRGIASWYGKKFHGHSTSSGEIYDMYAMSAAHKSLPLPTYVRVTHESNGRSVIVKVNDRGPFAHNRVIDLSYAAAKKLGITAKGTGMVRIEAIDPFTYRAYKKPAATSSAPVPVPSQARHSAPAAATANSANPLYLQAGAFISRENAEQLRSRLLAKFAFLNINMAFNEARRLYRVRIGPFSSSEEADALASRIYRSGLPRPHIVID